ncbi:hypothetical protein [Limibacterium fermenti]|uniref:hypothetical protein n=1 Tax=Limibacterium fermenti TaxID=3229863 RepID=UPI003A6FB05D
MAKVTEKSSSVKRRILKDSKECILDLEEELEILFKAFYKAVTLYEKEVAFTPPSARCRGYEAVILNSKMIQCVMEVFPEHSKFGKYKRFMVRINGYICFFKKLDNKNMPMNIKTINSSFLTNQQQGKLFDISDDGSEPILYFGYNKNKFGEIKNPKLVYIDEDKFRWQITEGDIRPDTKDIPLTPLTGVLEHKSATLREGTRKNVSGE